MDQGVQQTDAARRGAYCRSYSPLPTRLSTVKPACFACETESGFAASNGLPLLEFSRERQSVASVHVSPDERFVAARWNVGSVEVWSLPERRQVFQAHYPQREPGTDTVTFLWECETGRELDSRKWARAWGVAFASALSGLLAFSPDGQLLAVTHTLRQLRLLTPDGAATLATLDAPTPERITALTFSGDGSVLAAATDAGEIQVWKLRDQRLSYQ